VFFDHPLAVAAEGAATSPGSASPGSASPGADSRPVAAVPNGGPAAKSPNRPSEAGGGSEKNTATAEKIARTGKNDWNSLVDIDILDAEVKRIRNDLTAQLQSVGKYNSHYQDIALAGATLALVGEIVAEHSGSASWKSHAPLVRDLGMKIHDSAQAAGGPALHATKASYEELVDVLDGNAPAGAAAAQPQRDFSEIAKRDSVMKRMDRSFQWLKKSGPAQQILKKQSANALHEASLLAALGRVITAGHYDSADDPKYKDHAEDLTKSAAAIAAAVKSNDPTAFTDAVNRVQKRCDACHADYRFQ
jgi:cytochrome c556